MFLLLMGSIAVPWNISLVVTVIVLAVCTPLSSIIARLVEGKKFTLTVGGAVFGGLLISPWIVHLLNMQAGTFLGYTVPVLPTMAAMAIAYGVGEGPAFWSAETIVPHRHDLFGEDKENRLCSQS